MLHFVRTQFSEINIRNFQSEKTTNFNSKVTAALQQLTEFSTEGKIAFFLHFHRQEKGGMRFYFENTPWPVKEGCIRWRVFWNLPETGSGRPIFRDIIYLLRQHSCLPQDNFLQPTQIPKSASGTLDQEGELISWDWRRVVMKGDKLYTRLLVVEILPRASKLQFKLFTRLS